MAVNHILFNQGTKWGQQLAQTLLFGEQFMTNLNDLLDTMTQMLDGGAATQYMVDRFGFADVATAQAAFNELDSLRSKLNSDASQSGIHAAIMQAFAKFG